MDAVTQAKQMATGERAVMIVDDDDAIRDALQDVLRDEGYQVIEAADGQQALGQLRGGLRPNAILLDLWMPVMDGWQFRDAVMDDPELRNIPMIVLTAARHQRADELGVAEVLTKPVTLERLLGVLHNLTST